MLAVPVTGFMMTSYHGYGTYFFFWEFNSPVEESDVYIVWGLFHKYLLPYLIYIILGAHILGALKHHFVDKNESAIKRMLSALDEFFVQGIKTNHSLHQDVLNDKTFIENKHTINYLETEFLPNNYE